MPQPDEQADQTRPGETRAPTGDEAAAARTTGGGGPAASGPAAALPADGAGSTGHTVEPAGHTAEPASRPVGDLPTQPTEPATRVETEAPTVAVTRWTGSAPVSRPTERKRRWRLLGGDREPAPPPPREPTLELPPPERSALEELPPVDPWAEHSPLPAPYPAAVTPPTLPYPTPTPPPQPPSFAAPPVPAPAGPARCTTAPPAWWPPPGYPPARRRRRRWPWVLLAMTLLTVGCCCGLPAYWVAPISEQYPAKVSLPDRVGDLRRSDDATSRRVTQRLEQQVRGQHPIAEVFAAIYRAPNGKLVTVFGATGFRWSPDKDLDSEVAWLTPQYHLTGLRPVDTGVRGEHVTCGTGRANGTGVVACVWADHGSIGTALFTRLSVDDSADLLADLRGTIISRG